MQVLQTNDDVGTATSSENVHQLNIERGQATTDIMLQRIYRQLRPKSQQQHNGTSHQKKLLYSAAVPAKRQGKVTCKQNTDAACTQTSPYHSTKPVCCTPCMCITR